MAGWFASGSVREVEVVEREDRIELRFGPMSLHMSPAEARRFHKQLTAIVEKGKS